MATYHRECVLDVAIRSIYYSVMTISEALFNGVPEWFRNLSRISVKIIISRYLAAVLRCTDISLQINFILVYGGGEKGIQKIVLICRTKQWLT